MSAYITATEQILANELKDLTEKKRLLRVKLSALDDVSSSLSTVSEREQELFHLAKGKLELDLVGLEADILATEVTISITRRYMLEQANAFSDHTH